METFIPQFAKYLSKAFVVCGIIFSKVSTLNCKPYSWCSTNLPISLRVSPILLLALKRIASNSPLPFGTSPNVLGSGKQYYQGRFDLSQCGFSSLSGAFDYIGGVPRDSDIAQSPNPAHPNGIDKWTFDASRCSPIYKSTSKISVNSFQALMIIKA